MTKIIILYTILSVFFGFWIVNKFNESLKALEHQGETK